MKNIKEQRIVNNCKHKSNKYLKKYFITRYVNLDTYSKYLYNELQPLTRDFYVSSPNYVSKRKYSVTLDFDVYEDFNPYEIDWNKIFQIEGQEHLDVNIRNLDEESDINW